MTTNDETVQAYMDGVLDGSIVAGRLVILAVRRHLDDLENAGDRGFYFDEKIADEACEFFPSVLKHSKGAAFAGKPFILSPYQVFITWCLFGWRRKVDGTRRFRKAYVTKARKNGKTEFAAGLGLLVLVADNPIEPGAEVYVAATKEDQACQMFNEAKAMVNQSPALSRACEVMKKNVGFGNSFMRPLGSDSKTNAGWNPHLMVIDELCDWQEYHRGLWGALTTGSGARTQPLRFATCTAGNDESDIWKEEDDYAVAVVESVLTGNVLDDAYFAFIARLDEARTCDKCKGDADGCEHCENGTIPADDPFDESNWEKSNPNISYIGTLLADLRDQATEAKGKPSSKQDFLRYRMNIMVTRSFKAIDMGHWPKGGVPLSDWSQSNVYGAFDLGWSSDLASISLVTRFFEGEGDGHSDRYRYECRSWSFLCEECKYDLTTEPWATFISSGCLTITPGSITDIPGAFRQKILDVTDEFNVLQWAHDTSGALHLAIELQNEGIETFKFPQSFGMYTPAFKLYLDLVADGLFVHNNDRLLEWTARNLVAKEDHRKQIMPDKQKSKSKIDPQSATIMAIGGAMTGVESGFWTPAWGV